MLLWVQRLDGTRPISRRNFRPAGPHFHSTQSQADPWTLKRHPTTFDELLAAAKLIAQEVAAPNAADVDAKARFPQETVDAMKRHRLLSAAVPVSHGGPGLGMYELGQLCSAIAGACGSSGMVLAMHYSQLGTLVRHGVGTPWFDAYLREVVENQYVLASITSEVGTWGSTRTSICALQREGDRFTLNKEATTGSYCANSDAILVTCRRDNDAAESDQILVLVKPCDYTLTQTTTWDTLGMRGTVSPGFSLKSNAPIEQVVPGSLRRQRRRLHGPLLAHPVVGAVDRHRHGRHQQGRRHRASRRPSHPGRAASHRQAIGQRHGRPAIHASQLAVGGPRLR